MGSSVAPSWMWLIPEMFAHLGADLVVMASGPDVVKDLMWEDT